MKHQENITSHNNGCNYIKLPKGSLMNMFNKYSNKHRKKKNNKTHVSLDSTKLKTIRNGINTYTDIFQQE